MTRNLKALGWALVAALAMSAVAASAAQAAPEFTAASYPASWHATTSQKIGEEKEYFESAGSKLECEVIHLTGETLAASKTTLTVTPDYTDHTQGGNCRTNKTLKVTITENGCAYVFHNLKTAPANGHYETSVSIECPTTTTPTHKTHAIEMHINNLFGGPGCTITVPEQTVTGTLTLKNDPATGVVTASGELTFHRDVHHEATACGGKAGETTLNSLFVYKMNVLTTFTGSGGTGISVSHPA